MLCDMTAIGLTGKTAEQALDRAGITVNMNMIPFDQRKPLDPSGIRIGTAALTTRGMKEDDMKKVGEWILEVLRNADNHEIVGRVREEVRQFASTFPVPGNRITVTQLDGQFVRLPSVRPAR